MVEFLCRKLGWEPRPGEGHLDAMLRGEVLTALAVFGHDLTINEASRRFHAFLDDRNTPVLPPDIRKVNELKVLIEFISYSIYSYPDVHLMDHFCRQPMSL